MERFQFLGYPIHRTSLPEAVTWACTRKGQDPAVIVVVNANKLWLAGREPALAAYMRGADLALPEYSVVWGARVLGLPPLEPVYGVSFARALLRYAGEHGVRVFLLGGRAEVAASLPARLQQAIPGLQLAGVHHGYIDSPALNEEVIGRINASQADVLLVGMGSPRQELWIQANRARLRVGSLAGVGGSLDVLAGAKEDLTWARGTGFEWLFRLLQQPGRYWKRYLVTNPWFLWQIARERYLKPH